MKKSNTASPFVARILIFLLVFIGVGALISGPMLFLAPDGHLMKIVGGYAAGNSFYEFPDPGSGIVFVCRHLSYSRQLRIIKATIVAVGRGY